MKIKSYDWLLCGCHALSEVAIAYFPNFQYNSSAVRAFRRTITEPGIAATTDGSGIHPAHPDTYSPTDCRHREMLGNACAGI